jgi:hypothetical protein
MTVHIRRTELAVEAIVLLHDALGTPAHDADATMIGERPQERTL